MGLTHAVLRAAERLGVPGPDVLARAGVDSVEVGHRIACNVDTRVWTAVAELSSDEDFGLHFVERDLELRAFGPLAVGALTCETLTTRFAGSRRSCRS